MEALVERTAGLDVDQASIVAGVLIGRPGEKPRKEVCSFGTMTADLEAVRDWLKELGVTHVGMESTGIYWMPVHNILEGHFNSDRRQCPPHQSRAGAQDRREGCQMDR